jgi:hypothetical protein
MRCQGASTARSAGPFGAAFSVWEYCSIGLRSGLQGGRKRSLALSVPAMGASRCVREERGGRQRKIPVMSLTRRLEDLGALDGAQVLLAWRRSDDNKANAALTWIG